MMKNTTNSIAAYANKESDSTPFDAKNIPQGYQSTEVGVIPEDWEVKALGDITETNRPISYGIVQIGPFIANGIECLRVIDIDNGRINKNNLIRTTKEISYSYKRTILKAGDLVMPLRGKVGDIGIIDEDLVGANLTRGVSLIAIRQEFSGEYCKYYISAPFTRIRLEQSMNGSALQEIPIAALRNFKIAIPISKNEQQAIAAALSDVDGLIEALEALIVKKRHIKQGTMQELLTGHRRLPGFTGAWGVKRLGEIGVFFKGSGVKKEEALTGEIPCIRYGEIYTHHNNYIKKFNSFISFDIAKTATKIKKGDLLFAGSGETKMEIGKCVSFLDEHEAYAGGDIVIFRPLNIDSLFMGYYCNTPLVVAQKSSKGQGDAVVHISSTALSEIEIPLPPLPEQTAIAAVLSDMDAEIAALEAQLEKTRAVKQGMMQELLTGRVRFCQKV